MHLYPKTLNTPRFHAEHCRVCQQKCRVYSTEIAHVLVEVLEHLVSLRLLALSRLSEKDVVKSPAFLPLQANPQRERCRTYLPFCFSSVSISQQFGSKTNYCDLLGDDPVWFFLRSRSTKNFTARRKYFKDFKAEVELQT